MRILSVRGTNLASLRSFDLRFDQPPLAGAGLVVVWGPTGAGKSTILDAICLGLYGETPRLKAGEALADLIHRGRRETEVAVEVEARGRRLRGTWSLSLTKGGRVNPARMELADLDEGRVIAEKKRDVEVALRARVGLSFEEFRRAVLLAQGDFASFLRAKPPERTALLEQLTGATVYRRLSQRAWERARAARQAVETVEARLSGLVVLGDEERAAHVARLVELELGRAGLDAERASLVGVIAWFETGEKLARDQADAEVGVARAWEARQALAALEGELVASERAEGLRAELDRLAADEAESAVLEAEIRKADADRIALEGRRAQLDRVSRDTEAALDTARRRREAAGPDLEVAASLDGEIEAGGSTLEEAKKVEEAATRSASDHERTATEIRRRRESAEVEVGRETSWIAAHRALEDVAGGLTDLVARVRSWGEERRTAADLAVQRRTATEARDRAAVAVDTTGQAEEKAAAKARDLAEARRIAQEALEALLGGEDAGALREAHRAVLARESALTRLGAALEKVASHEDERRRAEERSRNAVARGEAARTALAELDEGLGAAEAAVAISEARLAALDAERAVEGRRQDLRAGEPCPLCGATAHPWAGRVPPGADVVAEAKASLRGTRKVREDLLKLRGELEGEQAARRREAAEAASQAGKAAEARTGAEVEAHRVAGEAGWAADPDLDAVGDARDAARRSGALLGPRVGRVEVAEGRLERARSACESAEATLRELRAHREGAQAALEMAALRFQKAAEAADGALRRADLAGSALHERLRGAGVADALAAGDAGRLEEEIAALAAAWTGHRTARDEAEERLRRAEAERAGADGRLATAREAVVVADRRRKEAAGALETLLRRRAGLLGGRAVAEVRSELERVVTAVEKGSGEARERLQGVERGIAALQERRSGLDSRRGRLADAEAARRAALEGAAREAGFPGMDAARGALRPVEARAGARVRLQQAADALARAEAVRRERSAKLADHEALRPAGVPDATSGRLLLADAEARLRAAAEELGGLRQRLADDEARRAEVLRWQAERDGRLAVLRRAQVLSDLIGSASGDAFQRFAQGLTLEQLLRRANRQLVRLRPRYALERVPGQDLGFQVVDRHMADERRAVETLSGGESFLASLALALGLSDIARGRVALGSLFLDEGFGTLDPDSLETALAALDELQAEGRQVFLVSHVEALHERLAVGIEVRPVGGGVSEVRVG